MGTCGAVFMPPSLSLCGVVTLGDDHHGPVGAVQHAVRHAAQQHALGAADAPTTHHDRRDVVLTRGRENAAPRTARRLDREWLGVQAGLGREPGPFARRLARYVFAHPVHLVETRLQRLREAGHGRHGGHVLQLLPYVEYERRPVREQLGGPSDRLPRIARAVEADEHWTPAQCFISVAEAFSVARTPTAPLTMSPIASVTKE